jgi:hypothetical protein
MAGDQIEIQLPKTRYPERTSFTATAYFRTRSTAAAATPTTVHYRIDNLSTRQQITDWTSVTPGSYSNWPRWETKQLTVAIDKDLDSMVIANKNWRCDNKFGIS